MRTGDLVKRLLMIECILGHLPMKHDPLRDSNDALLGFVERGELCSNRVVVVSHGFCEISTIESVCVEM